MKIEAVTVCVNFADCLKLCIDNKNKLDRWIVVTHVSDRATINLCSRYEIIYCLCNKFYENGAKFAKGKAINAGLEYLDKDSWVLFMDADIKLPDNFRERIDIELSNKKCLYGAHRIYNGKKMTPSIGFWPISGYFQLCHSDYFKKYSDISMNASTDDWKFYFDFLSQPGCIGQYLSFNVTTVSNAGFKNWNGKE